MSRRGVVGNFAKYWFFWGVFFLLWKPYFIVVWGARVQNEENWCFDATSLLVLFEVLGASASRRVFGDFSEQWPAILLVHAQFHNVLFVFVLSIFVFLPLYVWFLLRAFLFLKSLPFVFCLFFYVLCFFFFIFILFRPWVGPTSPNPILWFCSHWFCCCVW